MFTGLIEATGRVERAQATARGQLLRIATTLGADLRAGDSIATSGVCLTVTDADASGFSAELSPETLRVTSFSTTTAGRHVNLERPLRADGRVGGHFVQGHVDAVGRVAALRPDGDCYWLDVDVPPALAPLLVLKGSIAVDGISLTIASLAPSRVGVQIVPFTWTHTTLKDARVGDPVNLEADIIGKYVARLLGSMTIEGRAPLDVANALVFDQRKL